LILLTDDVTNDLDRLLRDDKPNNDDAIIQPEFGKRYMRFGRKFQRQNERLTSEDKRYMRFGRQQQTGYDTIEHVTSMMTSLSRGNKEQGAENKTQLDEKRRFKDSSLRKDAAVMIANKRYMRFGRR